MLHPIPGVLRSWDWVAHPCRGVHDRHRASNGPPLQLRATRWNHDIVVRRKFFSVPSPWGGALGPPGGSDAPNIAFSYHVGSGQAGWIEGGPKTGATGRVPPGLLATVRQGWLRLGPVGCHRSSQGLLFVGEIAFLPIHALQCREPADFRSSQRRATSVAWTWDWYEPTVSAKLNCRKLRNVVGRRTPWWCGKLARSLPRPPCVLHPFA